MLLTPLLCPQDPKEAKQCDQTFLQEIDNLHTNNTNLSHEDTSKDHATGEAASVDNSNLYV